MADDAAAAAAAATAASAAGAAAPWHAGVEPEVLGAWQNKGWKFDDPKALATDLTKAWRAAEQHIGVPADRLLKLPADAKDEAGWKAVHQRLGTPAEAKDYDFSTVKNAAGQGIDNRLADALRTELHARNVTKDAAPSIAQAIVKHFDGVNAEQMAVSTAKLAEERAALKANWGDNFDFNHLKAIEGARRLGIAPEGVAALEKQIGYSAVMEAMRKIGAATSEDMFVDGARSGVMTAQGASARKAELMADQAWAKRLTSGDAATVREWQGLELLIHNANERAA